MLNSEGSTPFLHMYDHVSSTEHGDFVSSFPVFSDVPKAVTKLLSSSYKIRAAKNLPFPNLPLLVFFTDGNTAFSFSGLLLVLSTKTTNLWVTLQLL